MFGYPSAVAAGAGWLAAAAVSVVDADDSAALTVGEAGAGSVGGSGVELTTGSGVPPDGSATTSAFAAAGDEASARPGASPSVYATPLRTSGSEVAATPASGLGSVSLALVPAGCTQADRTMHNSGTAIFGADFSCKRCFVLAATIDPDLTSPLIKRLSITFADFRESGRSPDYKQASTHVRNLLHQLSFRLASEGLPTSFSTIVRSALYAPEGRDLVAIPLESATQERRPSSSHRSVFEL